MGAEIIYKGIRICNLCLALLFLDTWARLSEISALPFANVHVADGWILMHGKDGRERALRSRRATQEHLRRNIDRWRPAAARGPVFPDTGRDEPVGQRRPLSVRASGCARTFRSAPTGCGTREISLARATWQATNTSGNSGRLSSRQCCSRRRRSCNVGRSTAWKYRRWRTGNARELLFQQRDMRAAANSGTRRAVPLLFACQA